MARRLACLGETSRSIAMHWFSGPSPLRCWAGAANVFRILPCGGWFPPCGTGAYFTMPVRMVILLERVAFVGSVRVVCAAVPGMLIWLFVFVGGSAFEQWHFNNGVWGGAVAGCRGPLARGFFSWLESPEGQPGGA